MAQGGLEGVVAAETALSLVDGERGELVIVGFPVAELALNATFEETAYLLWHGELPDAAALEQFRSDLAARRNLPTIAFDVLAAAAARRADPMDALRMAAGLLGGSANDQMQRPSSPRFPRSSPRIGASSPGWISFTRKRISVTRRTTST